MALFLVQIDITQKFTDKIWLDPEKLGYFQQVVMEDFPPFCEKCRSLGHSKDACWPSFNFGSVSTNVDPSKPCSTKPIFSLGNNEENGLHLGGAVVPVVDGSLLVHPASDEAGPSVHLGVQTSRVKLEPGSIRVELDYQRPSSSSTCLICRAARRAHLSSGAKSILRSSLCPPSSPKLAVASFVVEQRFAVKEGGVDTDPASLPAPSNGVEVDRAKGDCLAVPEAGVLSPIFNGRSGTLECSLPSPVLPKNDGFSNENNYCINLNASHLRADAVTNSGDLSIVVGSRDVVPSLEALLDSPIHTLVGNVVSSPLESVVRDAVKGNAEYVDIPILVMTNAELKAHLARSLNNSVLVQLDWLDMDDDLSVHVIGDMSSLKVGCVDQAVLNGGGKKA
ncbi:hypothetical protein M5K25_008025 [Dendrobium thyrsiflorum]|uniref:DUF4283 domain-containing protein n=1 Tax=Dendrobium thyrsiflorum TaxID=117978 RepID=A0ABD0V7E0_DENTH